MVCMAAAKMGLLHWRSVQESLLNLGKTNVTSVESIVRIGMEVKQLLRANLSSAATTVLEEVDDWNKTLHYSLVSELHFLLPCSN
ncbi:hypothetical protein HPP92_001321 [Vanilla planifolia]|uniref:Uncharacterized protein n=1 Tax=Vanilla planifolia TaxID=51239 RepID=A0A835VDL8_VANPL|nr:hypothetical protein HPP92_001500 [Vanilla planifolia]KAG0501249.1 hypothetical protein HPP92_001321 [Vanilla planifolia]